MPNNCRRGEILPKEGEKVGGRFFGENSWERKESTFEQGGGEHSSISKRGIMDSMIKGGKVLRSDCEDRNRVKKRT